MKTTYLNKVNLILLMFAMALVGCDTVDSSSEREPAPDVIPAEAFAMNLDMFNEQASKSTHNSSHYIAAVWRASVATVVTGSILYYPATVTKAIQGVDPIVEGNSYVWAVDTTIAGRTHGVALTASPNRGAINWTMTVSGIEEESGQYLDDFVLYEASTGVISNSGTFQVYYPVDGASLKVMEGAYEVEDEDTHTLEFSIPVNIEDIGGSVAIFSHDDLINSIDLTGPQGGNHYIEWNTQTNEGSLTADDYNNGEQACWDTQLQNVDCQGV